jgi:hypothetical protein
MLPQPGGRLTATNTPLRMLIMAAFELKQEAQLAGGPPNCWRRSTTSRPRRLSPFIGKGTAAVAAGRCWPTGSS